MERLPFKDMIYRMKTSLNLNTQCRTFSFGLLVLRFSEQLSMPIAKLAESYRALFTSIRACITLGLSVRSDAYTTNYLGIRASRTNLSFVLVSCLCLFCICWMGIKFTIWPPERHVRCAKLWSYSADALP
jgi:hypothetical protein